MDILDKVENDSTGKSVEDVLKDGYRFDLGGYLSNAFGIYGKDAGNFIGFSLVYFVIWIAITLIAGLIPIPFLDNVLGLFYMAPLNAGIYAFMKARKSGFEIQFGNFFDGFRSPHWIRLVLSMLIGFVVTNVIFAAIVFPSFWSIIVEFLAELENPDTMSDPERFMGALKMFMNSGIFGYAMLAWLIAFLITTLWVLAPLFILNRDMGFWEAMEASRKIVQKKYFHFLALMLVLNLLWLIGFLLCGVGLIVTYPVYCLGIYAAYCHIMEEKL